MIKPVRECLEIHTTTQACHSEQPKGAKNLVFQPDFATKAGILRRFAAQNDMT